MTTNNITVQYRERLASLNAALAALEKGEALEVQNDDGGWENLSSLTNGWANDVLQCLYKIRVKPKPEPKIPDGVFWIREHSVTKSSGDYQVIFINDSIVSVMGPGGRLNYDHSVLFNHFYWSRDRVTWFNFTGEEVKP